MKNNIIKLSVNLLLAAGVVFLSSNAFALKATSNVGPRECELTDVFAQVCTPENINVGDGGCSSEIGKVHIIR